MRIPSLVYPCEALSAGSSLGNMFAFARLDRETNLDGLWSSTDNRYVVGHWDIRFSSDGEALKSRTTTFMPEGQTTIASIGGLEISKIFFLPYTDAETTPMRPADLRICVFVVDALNRGDSAKDVSVEHTITFPAVRSTLFTKQPLEEQTGEHVRITDRGTRIEAVTEGTSGESRVLKGSHPFEGVASDSRELSFVSRWTLPAGGAERRWWMLAFSPEGMEDAIAALDAAQGVDVIHARTREQLESLLSRTQVFTPEQSINRAIAWAKINVARVQHLYRTGYGFTNDPPQDIVVIRDLAWYMLGSDFITPSFSRKLVELTARHAFHEGGKLTEYIHADEESPCLHDYKLNINDDTPLFVWALVHHARAAGGRVFLEESYPLMKRAADWIMSQTEGGLVRCHANGTNVWGICSWRNIIDDYNLTGAVTEINVECSHALALTGMVAAELGRKDEADLYGNAALDLRQAINAQLRSEQTGMYLLNLGDDGVRHHDTTGDLVFPVLFGVADPEVRSKILGRLTEADMWTPFGSRTVSPAEKNYDPDAGYQLVGGLWPNLMAWIAYCIRKENPERVREALENIARLLEVKNPVEFGNAVPGEFPERIHGTTFHSRGMTLSPWTPPTYLWLAVEGLLGVDVSTDALEISPSLPRGWNWIAVKNLMYQGKSVDALLYEGTLYASLPLRSERPVVVGEKVSVSSNARIFTLGFRLPDRLVIFAACEEPVEGTASFDVDGARRTIPLSLGKGEATLLSYPL